MSVRTILLFAVSVAVPAAGPQSAPEAYTRAWATFVGGNSFERAQGCAVDAAGNIYIVGNTTSPNLPTTPGAFQGSFNGGGGGGDGYVAKLSSDGQTLQWCTYLGGSDEDRSYGVQVDSTGVYVTTWTKSANFPVTAGAYDTQHNSPGVMDVAYTKLRTDGTGLIWSTFVGGSGTEQARGSIFVNSARELYSSGWTDSPNFPTTTGAYQSVVRGGGDAFVFQLSSDGSQLLHSTLFGGSHPTFVESGHTRVSVHTDGTVYISGSTRSTDLPVTSNAFQQTYGGDAGALGWHGDAFVARFNATLSGLIYSTYVGGSSGDEASVNNGLAVDAAGRAVLLGNTTSTNFPTTAGAFQQTQRGGPFGDGFVAILSANGSQLVAATLIGGTDSEETSGVSIDSAGNVYFSGNTASSDYPVTSNALQSAYRGAAGNTDGWFTKLSPTLSTLLYSTYLGGSGTTGGFGDRGRCLILAPGGDVVVTGDSNSADFPVTAGAYDTSYNGGNDAFVAKFSLSASAPAAPSALSATAVSASRINLSWTDNSGNETGFKIERKTGAGGTYSQIATVGANVTAFGNVGLSAATQYFYRVRATGAGGDSGYSNEANATTQTAGPDTDGDGLPDAWEQQYFTNLSQTGSGDPDADGLTNAQEFAAGTNPTLADTDGDGMADGAEVGFAFDPLNGDQDANSQADGLDDWDGDGIINQLDPTPGSVPSSSGPPPGDESDDRCGATGFEALILAFLLRRYLGGWLQISSSGPVPPGTPSAP